MHLEVGKLQSSDSSITVVIVTFNSALTIKTCLESLPNNFEIIVVDQNSSDQTIEFALSARPDINIVHNLVNTGYSAGCNTGAARSNGANLLFLNPDAAFQSKFDARAFAATAQKTNALIAPRVMDQHGRDQSLIRRWSTPLSMALKLSINISDRSGKEFTPKDHYVSGPCLLISKNNFDAVHGFDDSLFLYREEETLARRLRGIGVDCYLNHSISIKHIGGVSTRQVFEFSFRQSIRSDIVFARRHFGTLASILISGIWLYRLTVAAALVPFFRSGDRLRSRLKPAICISSMSEPFLTWMGTPVKPPEAENYDRNFNATRSELMK